jgi:2-aminobenzoate-CoA ligase
MGTIPTEYLPPREYSPEKIYPLPEVRLPEKINFAQVALDKNVLEGRGSKVAILYKNLKITYLELQRDTNRLANALRSLGIEKNDRVMLRSPNRPEFVVACFACWKIGAIPVLVNHMLRPEEIIFRANDSEAKAIFVNSDSFSDVERALKEFRALRHLILLGDRVEKYLYYEDLLSGQSDEVRVEETTKDDIIRIIYSSGTTGKPKGILQTIGDAVASREITARYLINLKAEDVVGGHPAFTFAFGFGFIIVFFGYMGCTLSVVEQFDPALMFETVEAHKISVLCCVPTAFRMMLRNDDAERKYNLKSLRLCQSAGEWLPAVVVKEWEKRFGVKLLDSVGSGELNYILSTRVDTPEEKLDSSGIPVPGVECRVVDENFNEVTRGTPGELLVRAPWGNQYWRRPDKQKEGVWKGWSRTGLVCMEDEDGYFWYRGRDDEMIVGSGYKIPGGEVEAALLMHEAVSEAAVVASPDAVRGNIVKAFVVLKGKYKPSEALAEELKDFVKDKIEAYKYPREIEFVDGKSLPRTTTGKIQRFVLRDKERQKAKRNGQ